METRALLERLEEEGGEPTAALAWLAVQGVDIAPDELSAARRRSMLLLASGGDPRRELEPDGRAVGSLADDLDRPERRAGLQAALAALRVEADGLPTVASALDALSADGELAWRWAACALLAEELTE
ncbi:MAG TPA: hypothetical protein VGQ15_12760 [Gaiellaceae bacterium]|nr:hypothetical protein [Gaiellaceae bacterium]